MEPARMSLPTKICRTRNFVKAQWPSVTTRVRIGTETFSQKRVVFRESAVTLLSVSSILILYNLSFPRTRNKGRSCCVRFVGRCSGSVTSSTIWRTARNWDCSANANSYKGTFAIWMRNIERAYRNSSVKTTRMLCERSQSMPITLQESSKRKVAKS